MLAGGAMTTMTMAVVLAAACTVCLAAGAAEPRPREGPGVDLAHGDLKVAGNRRFLVHADGAPFFYLADTAWELFHKLEREEADRYLENRRAKGFTVIQAVALAELDGLGVPNAYGHRPLVDNDATRPAVADGPDNDYWDHVDYIVDRAAAKGLFIGMLPTWGDKWTVKWGKGPAVFTPETAGVYGEWLGRRYRDKPIIWILGGDRNPETDAHLATIRAMAAGLARGDGGRHLMTFHPTGGSSSAQWFQGDEWLAFNMIQSGHNEKDGPNYRMIEADYARTPTKPCMDGEPRYEDHPVAWKSQERGWFDDYDVRQAAYWALLAGAHGHTYGCHPVWRMYDKGHEEPLGKDYMRHYWHEVLDLPGAWQMLHVRRLLESRPMLDRVPDQGLLAEEARGGADHVQASRGKDYAFVYVPTGRPVTVKLGAVSGSQVKAWWFDPRTGEATAIGVFANQGTRPFDPPGEPARGNDWVLVLDDAARGYPPPGSPAR